MLTYREVIQAVDDGCLVDVVFLDFSIAFDIVNHSIVLLKLQRVRICCKLLAWRREFLLVGVCRLRSQLS